MKELVAEIKNAGREYAKSSVQESPGRPAETDVTLVNGLNSNIAGALFIRVTGPTGAFSVGGFSGGADGRTLRLFNDVAQTMTIVNEDASSTEANRITTLTGGNVALRTDGRSFATFIYSGTNSRWILMATN